MNQMFVNQVSHNKEYCNNNNKKNNEGHIYYR